MNSYFSIPHTFRSCSKRVGGEGLRRPSSCSPLGKK